MPINIGNIDRIARAVLGIALLYIAFVSGALDGNVWKWAAVVAGIVMLATSTIRFCPLYSLIGLKTCRSC